MRLEMIRGISNVVRFPVERRATPSLKLVREIAPDVCEVLMVMEAFGLERPVEEIRSGADRETADYIRDEVPNELGHHRHITLTRMRAKVIDEAIRLNRQAYETKARAEEAHQQLATAQDAGGYWLLPLEERADSLTEAAARHLVAAYVAAEQAEGAIRAIELAMRNEPWRPLDRAAEAEALFFGPEARVARSR